MGRTFPFATQVEDIQPHEDHWLGQTCSQKPLWKTALSDCVNQLDFNFTFKRAKKVWGSSEIVLCDVSSLFCSAYQSTQTHYRIDDFHWWTVGFHCAQVGLQPVRDLVSDRFRAVWPNGSKVHTHRKTIKILVSAEARCLFSELFGIGEPDHSEMPHDIHTFFGLCEPVSNLFVSCVCAGALRSKACARGRPKRFCAIHVCLPCCNLWHQPKSGPENALVRSR